MKIRRMVEEAPLARVGSGLTPRSDGWFVVNAGEAAWLVNDAFGARCVFEADTPVVRGSDFDVHRFPQLGITLAVLEPGKPSGLYHHETNQEDFLVLTGECLLIVEDEERPLRAWDFVHCPPGTAHAFFGSGDEPCVILMVGARTSESQTVYPDSALARSHGAGAEAETSSARDAYAPFGHWRRGRPNLPWA
jgi:uncharacterized cupin superfamily protein